MAPKETHSKCSTVELTLTYLLKNETHPETPLQLNWHLKAPYSSIPPPCCMLTVCTNLVSLLYSI